MFRSVEQVVATALKSGRRQPETIQRLLSARPQPQERLLQEDVYPVDAEKVAPRSRPGEGTHLKQ